ncbi:MAG: mechanosensitive ion channel [Saprospiraceae bacterium]|nr:mechanosensitive ion channel [Saprospiraceae bacterium]MCB0678831.1 mechanosensitive ion channel [Saprospiraceae bacterium]MCB0680884.1 mechanosensitive ion channel [Saprospiraceae bacterium]
MENYDLLTKVYDFAISYAPKLVGAILVLIVGFWIVRQLVGMMKRSMEKAKVDADLRPFLTTLVNVLLKVLVVFSAAGIVGIETASFVALIAAAGFAIGLALQGTLGHFAAGVLILFFKPYRTGDFIVAQGYAGTVKEIQIFNTILTTLDNRIIIVPNGAISGGPIENLSAPGVRKVDLTFGISYGDDIDTARAVIQKVVDANPTIQHDRGVEIFVKELGDSSVNFAVRVWVKHEDYWDVYFYMHEQVKKAFDREGVNIPFPQVDVHMKGN